MRENFIKQAASFKDFRAEMTLPGIVLNNSREKYTLYHQLQMTEFDGSSWQLTGELLSDGE